jgi:hypothetical protein
MICVVEYGKNIGTLRNIFPDKQQALAFAQRIIALSDGEVSEYRAPSVVLPGKKRICQNRSHAKLNIDRTLQNNSYLMI